MCSRAVLLVLIYASFDNRELRLYRSVVLEVNSVLMTLGERLGPWFKRKYRPGKKKKPGMKWFLFCYIFLWLRARSRAPVLGYTITESKNNEIQTETDTRNHKAGCKLLSH